MTYCARVMFGVFFSARFANLWSCHHFGRWSALFIIPFALNWVLFILICFFFNKSLFTNSQEKPSYLQSCRMTIQRYEAGVLLHYQSHVDNRYKGSLPTTIHTMLNRAHRLSSLLESFRC